MDYKMKPHTAWSAKWIDMDDEPAPAGKKIQLLNNMGIAMYGKYIPPETGDSVYFIAWAPCLKINAKIASKLGFRAKIQPTDVD